MAAVTPVLGTIGTIASVGGSVLGAVQQAKTAKKQEKIQKKRIVEEQKNFEKDRKAALKRAIAKRRARFGASNVSMDGSGEAIILGLFEETDEELKRREQLDNLRRASVPDGGIASTRSLLSAIGSLGGAASGASKIISS